MDRDITFRVCKHINEKTEKQEGWGVYKLIGWKHYVLVGIDKTASLAQECAFRMAKSFADKGQTVTVILNSEDF